MTGAAMPSGSGPDAPGSTPMATWNGIELAPQALERILQAQRRAEAARTEAPPRRFDPSTLHLEELEERGAIDMRQALHIPEPHWHLRRSRTLRRRVRWAALLFVAAMLLPAAAQGETDPGAATQAVMDLIEGAFGFLPVASAAGHGTVSVCHDPGGDQGADAMVLNVSARAQGHDRHGDACEPEDGSGGEEEGGDDATDGPGGEGSGDGGSGGGSGEGSGGDSGGSSGGSGDGSGGGSGGSSGGSGGSSGGSGGGSGGSSGPGDSGGPLLDLGGGSGAGSGGVGGGSGSGAGGSGGQAGDSSPDDEGFPPAPSSDPQDPSGPEWSRSGVPGWPTLSGISDRRDAGGLGFQQAIPAPQSRKAEH